MIAGDTALGLRAWSVSREVVGLHPVSDLPSHPPVQPMRYSLTTLCQCSSAIGVRHADTASMAVAGSGGALAGISSHSSETVSSERASPTLPARTTTPATTGTSSEATRRLLPLLQDPGPKVPPPGGQNDRARRPTTSYPADRGPSE